MPTASTIASIVVALAAIAVVVRWPRPRADRRVLERRAHSLEALGVVVHRSVTTRAADVGLHATSQAAAPPPQWSAITVLGPADHTARPEGPRQSASDKRSRSTRRSHRTAPHPTIETTPHRTPPAQVVRLAADDLPADDDLTETVDGLTTPTAAFVHSGVPASNRQPTSPAVSPSPAPLMPLPARRRPQAVRRRAAMAAAAMVVFGGLAFAVVRPDGGLVPSVPAEGAGATPAPPPPATDSTLPPPLAPSATVGDAVAFDLAAPFTLDLAAGDTIWVRVQAVSGEVLFEGTLAPSDTTAVPVTGPVQVRIGNPAGLLAAADGRLLDYPRQPGQPVTLTMG